MGEDEDLMNSQKEGKNRKKSVFKMIPLWTWIAFVILVVIILLALFVTRTETGFKLFLNITAGKTLDEIQVTPEPEKNVGITATPTPFSEDRVLDENDIKDAGISDVEIVVGTPRSEEYVFNFLVIGEDCMDSETGRWSNEVSRADMIKMVSVNFKTKRITITSFLRDTLVAIPGYKDNRLSAAYIYGGADLLVDTIELNYNICIDGYVTVGYEAFETLIDGMGGVEITLTSDEAAYLNQTNYISKPSERRVYAGIQKMTGAQALGFCRIQDVTSKEGLTGDYGRVMRANEVLSSVFDAYKSNVFGAVFMLDKCLDYVRTDITRQDIIDVLYEVYNKNITSIAGVQMPYASGSRKMYYVSTVRDMEVIIPNTLDSNIEVLYSYVFGSDN